MRKILFFVVMSIFLAASVHAAQSTIKIAEGSACMGDDKSRKQTETAAMADAKRNAIESVKTYVSSATEVKDFELQKDLISAYANATVEVIEELQKSWYKDPSLGDCYKVKIKTGSRSPNVLMIRGDGWRAACPSRRRDRRRRRIR